MTSRAPLVALLLYSGCVSLGCGPAPLTPWSPPSSARLSADHDYLRDGAGRVAVLRGVNVRAGGIFDARVDPARCPPPTDQLEAIPDVTGEELDRMRDLGFSVLRLPVNWSAIEPSMGSYDEAYLDRVEALVSLAAEREIHTLIDFHQDGWSADLGEDGAPLWATYGASGPVDPSLLLCGPLGATLGDRRLSPAVGAAFTAFFDADSPSSAMLQSAYRAMVLHVVERFGGMPYVLGFDLFNEPVVDDRTLRALHESLATEIRAVDGDALLFFEPSGLRNLTERGFVSSAPFPANGAVYAPHLYTLAFADPRGELDAVTPELLAPNFVRMIAEARGWHTPLFVGEWGIRPDSPGTASYLAYTYDLFDASATSATVWVWKEASQGSWGFYGCEEGDATFESCVERPEQVAAHARVYAERIAGEPVRSSEIDPEGAAHYDPASSTFTLRFEGRSDDAPHVLQLPSGYPEPVAVSCDGTPLDPAPLRDPLGRVSVVCAGPGRHTLVLRPAP